MSTSGGTSASDRTGRILENVRPALELAKASVTGIGIPTGLEPAINGALHLTTMLLTMKANKEDLSKLEDTLKRLSAINVSGPSPDLTKRVADFTSNLAPLVKECGSVASKSGIKHFFKSKSYQEKIRAIKTSIATQIQEFTFQGSISIECLITDLASKVDNIVTSVDAVQKSADNIQASVNIVHSSVDIVHTSANNVRTDELLARLNYVPARYNGENTPDKCMDGTRVEIIQDIMTFLTHAPNPLQRVLMLSGSAGSGKSTIAKTIACLLADSHVLGASFFFSRDYADRNNLRGVPSTLARQLADYDVKYRSLLVKFLDEDRTGILSADPHLQFQKLVVGLLEQTAQRGPSRNPCIICLDALDECGTDRGQVLLRWLSDSIHQLPTHILVFLTGRPDVPFYLKFHKLRPLIYNIVLDDLAPDTVRRDVRLYVSQSLDGSRWITPSPWRPQDSDVDEITRRADGLFVFAATCVRYICGDGLRFDPQQSVDYLLEGAPLSHLDALYFRIVNEAISLPTARDPRVTDYHSDAMQVLGTILHLSEPLDLVSLAAVLQMKHEHIKRILTPLSSVIHLPDSVGTVKVIHLSFREFMISGILEEQPDPLSGAKKCGRPDLLCGTEDQQQLLTSNLIRVMQTELRFNICGLPTSYLRNSDMPEIQSRLTTSISGQLHYACRYWADHLTAVSFHFDIAQTAYKFVVDKFLFWLEVLSLTGFVGYGTGGLSRCVAWTKSSLHKEKAQPLHDFCSDGQRFITFFLPAIVQCAPQIYLSALALAPTQSKISTTFGPNFPRLLKVTKGQTEQWPATVAVLERHTYWVMSVAFSSDGKHIVSGSDDGTIRIWDAESGEQLGDPRQGHTNGVQSVAFSPDGKHIVSGSDDKSLRIWDAESGEQLGGPLEAHTREVTSVAFSPDGKHIVSGSRDKSLRIWDAKSGEQLGGPLEGHTNWVQSVAFSPDGKHIVSGSEDRSLRIWDAEGREQLGGPLEGHTSGVLSVAFSPDGKHIVSGSDDKSLRIWDAESGEQLGGPLEAHTREVTSVAFSPDGKHIVSGSRDKSLRICDAKSGEQLGGPLEGHTNWVQSVAFSPNGKHIVSGSTDNSVRIWDAESGEQLDGPLEGHTDSIQSVAFSPNGKHVVSGSLDKSVRIWHAESREQLGDPLEGHTRGVQSVAFSPDGKHIVSGSYDKSVQIWDAESGEQLGGLLKGHTAQVHSVAFSPNGKHIVSGSTDNSVRIWDAESGEQLGGLLKGHTAQVRSVAFSPNGKHIVSGSTDNSVRIWDAESGEQLGGLLKGHTAQVHSVAFSPNGKHIVSGSGDKSVRIWDAESGEQLGGPLEGHSDWVNAVAFSPNGKHIVSGSEDKSIRIWNADSGEQLGDPLEGHTAGVWSVAFSPNGKHIGSGSTDNSVRIWDAESGEQLGDPLEGHTARVWSVAFSPNRKHIVSGSTDNSVRIWDAESGDQLGGPLEGHTAQVTSVAFSRDGKHIVSGSADHTIRVWSISPNLPHGIFVPTSSHLMCSEDSDCSSVAPTSNPPSRWQSNEGWISQKSSELLFWLPSPHRFGFWMPENTLVIGRQQTKLSYETFVHGMEWTKCYDPEAKAVPL
ncbi:WD40-repeat-containing domain protein [Mycena vitilis]|nr:WD40-repeat-containing domain protein [Mycena vitilis]